MKTELYTNCSLVRLPITTGETKYYLPQNVDWANKRVDRLVVCAPNDPCIDPIDGVTPVITAADLSTLDAYINLYDENNTELMHDVSVENILHRNNNGLRVDAKLNLSLCNISLMSAPVADATLLLYIFYETREEEYFDMPRKSVTVEFPMAANEELNLRYIINQYVHALPAKIKGIICWNAVSDPVYLSLRDYNMTYQMTNIHSEMMRDDMNHGNAFDNQAALFFTNDLDIDFDYSHIREAAGQISTQKITFLF